jgi:hypothetical protein
MATEEEVRALKDRHSARLLREPGVYGVGIEQDDRGNYVLGVHLDRDDQALRERLPTEIEGHPVKYHYSGAFRKFPA